MTPAEEDVCKTVLAWFADSDIDGLTVTVSVIPERSTPRLSFECELGPKYICPAEFFINAQDSSGDKARTLAAKVVKLSRSSIETTLDHFVRAYVHVTLRLLYNAGCADWYGAAVSFAAAQHQLALALLPNRHDENWASQAV